MIQSVRWQKYLPLAAGVFLVLLVAAVFGQAGSFDFVNYDDTTYLIQNPYLRYGLTWQGVRWAFSIPIFSRLPEYSPFWRPLTYLTHMADMQLYGLKAGGHHLTSVVFHGMNVLLLFSVLLKATRRLWPSVFAASLFAVHPLQAENVAWISARTTLVSMFWGLWAVRAYLSYAEKPSKARYLKIVFFYALCLMSKSSLVSLPVMLLLLDYWPLGRAAWGRAELGRWKERIFEKWPLFAMAFAAGLLTLWTQPLVVHYFPSWESRFLTMLTGFGFYLTHALWPFALTVYPTWKSAQISAGQVIGYGFLLVALTEISFWKAKKSPYLWMGWLWYLAAIFPVTGLPQPADRYMYEPGIGLAVMAAWTLADLFPKWPLRGKALPAAGAALLLVLAVASFGQAGYWKDGPALYEHALKIYPDHYIAHVNLANAYASRGRAEKAIPHYQKAIEIEPQSVPSYVNLGTTLLVSGRLDEAAKVFVRVLELDPENWKAYLMLAWIAKWKGDIEKAKEFDRKAIELKPMEWEPYMNLGFILEEQGKFGEAVAQYELSLERNDNNPEVHYRLGYLKARSGDTEASRAHLAKAEKFSPGFLASKKEGPRVQN